LPAACFDFILFIQPQRTQNQQQLPIRTKFTKQQFFKSADIFKPDCIIWQALWQKVCTKFLPFPKVHLYCLFHAEIFNENPVFPENRIFLKTL